MTAFVTKRGRRAARTTVAAGTVSLGLLVLSGCQEPSPNAHFTLGSATSSRETTEDCYAHGGGLGTDRAQECMASDEDVPVFSTRTGDTFRIGVDPDVAESGWLLFLNDVLYDPNPFTTTYETFPVNELQEDLRARSQSSGLPQAQDMRLTVAQVPEDYDVEEIWGSASQEEFDESLFGAFEGVWNVDLEPED